MKFLLRGHSYQFAVEQSLLSFFPEEKPVCGEPEDGEDGAWISLHAGNHWWSAVTVLRYQGKRVVFGSRAVLSDTLDHLDVEREKQKIVKLSIFKAASAVTGATPAWGALTGIRPSKLAERFLAAGKSEAETDHILKSTYFVTPARRQLCIETAQAGLSAARDLNRQDIAVYLGIPFCPTRCTYCSFVSNSVEKSFHLIEPYLEALLEEVKSGGAMVQALGLRVKAFYMGGGTPTTLSAAQMDRLLTAFAQSFDLRDCRELTVEAGRPDTIDEEKLAVLKRHGVTRVSINPQTMEDHVLRAIGRKHSADDIRRSMEQVRRSGFAQVNMDLIAGLPEDSPEGFRRTLQEVLTLGANNITVHTLSLKKGSRLTMAGSAIPSAEAVGEMLEDAQALLRRAGFVPYYLYRQKYMSGSFENTGWCMPGCENLYNIYIMEELCSILSLGAGGSTKMVAHAGGRIERAFNLKYPQEYIHRQEKVAANQAAFAAFYENMKGDA